MDGFERIETKTIDFKNAKDFTINEKSIYCKKDTMFVIDKYDDKFVDINEDNKTVKCFFNVKMYVNKEYNTYLPLNIILTAKFTSYVENSNEYQFFIKANNFLFDTNLFEKDSSNAGELLNHMMQGKMDRGIGYNQIYDSLKLNLENNDIGKQPSLSYEIIITELCKSKEDPTVPFRFVVSKQNQSNGFVMINIRDISKGTSAISALNSEDMIDSLTTTIQNKRKNVKPILTPIEQISLSKFK